MSHWCSQREEKEVFFFKGRNVTEFVGIFKYLLWCWEQIPSECKTLVMVWWYQNLSKTLFHSKKNNTTIAYNNRILTFQILIGILLLIMHTTLMTLFCYYFCLGDETEAYSAYLWSGHTVGLALGVQTQTTQLQNPFVTCDQITVIFL